MGKGFLGTAASRAADLTLVIEIGMGLALVLGAVLARRRCYRTHAWCQSTVVLLNLAVIACYMMPSLRRQVAATIPAGFGDSYALLAAIHGGLGAVAELLALYILLSAGTTLLPHRLRFIDYRRWMRTLLALWWLALLLGLTTYARWYIIPLL